MKNIESNEDQSSEGEQTPFKLEYQDVIAEMSRICSLVQFNGKQENKDSKVEIK